MGVVGVAGVGEGGSCVEVGKETTVKTAVGALFATVVFRVDDNRYRLNKSRALPKPIAPKITQGFTTVLINSRNFITTFHQIVLGAKQPMPRFRAKGSFTSTSPSTDSVLCILYSLRRVFK